MVLVFVFVMLNIFYSLMMGRYLFCIFSICLLLVSGWRLVLWGCSDFIIVFSGRMKILFVMCMDMLLRMVSVSGSKMWIVVLVFCFDWILIWLFIFWILCLMMFMLMLCLEMLVICFVVEKSGVNISIVILLLFMFLLIVKFCEVVFVRICLWFSFVLLLVILM